MSEIQLLRECLNSQSEAEAGGVKFVWMDDNTVYRFENNRMKKVSKALINKAKKADVPTNPKRGRKTKQLMDNEEEQEEEIEPIKPTKPIKRTKQPKPIYDEDDEQEQEQEQEEPIRNEVLSYAKPTKPTKRAKQSKPDTNPANIDLNEYYHNKNKMEFMQQEMERMNKKITKLKQYKSMFNRLNGGEYDIQDTQPTQERRSVPASQPKQTMPENTKIINDSLFMPY